MDIPKIHEGEYRFCLIMWEREPVTAAELVKLCQEQLGWKRTTIPERPTALPCRTALHQTLAANPGKCHFKSTK